MTDRVWQRDEPDSPCIRLCLLDRASGLCLGCLRRADEIAAWPTMSARARQAIVAQLPARRLQLKPRRRGGRAQRHEAD